MRVKGSGAEICGVLMWCRAFGMAVGRFVGSSALVLAIAFRLSVDLRLHHMKPKVVISGFFLFFGHRRDKHNHRPSAG